MHKHTIHVHSITLKVW